MVTEPTHIEGRILDLMMTADPELVGVRIGSLVGTSDLRAVFIDVVLEQTVPHLVCRRKVSLKNSVDLELV